jgi:hypothetical protein
MSDILSWPVDEHGRPMRIAIGSITDTIKTAEYCSVKIGHTIMQPIPDGTVEDKINASRQVQREAEYVVGVERYLLNCELKGAVIPIHPATGERFAGAPNGYDPSSMEPHPADAANASSAEPAKS